MTESGSLAINHEPNTVTLLNFIKASWYYAHQEHVKDFRKSFPTNWGHGPRLPRLCS